MNKRCKLFEERLKQQNKRSIICSNERARDNYLHSINENITNDEKSLIDLRKSIKEQIDPRRDSGYGDYRELLKLLSYKYIVKDSERMLKENPMVAVFGIFSTDEGNYSGLLACKLAAIDNLRAEAKPPAQKDNKEHAT